MFTIHAKSVLLNFIKHMKKWGEQLDIRPPNPKIGGGRAPPPHLPQDRRPLDNKIINLTN